MFDDSVVVAASGVIMRPLAKARRNDRDIKCVANEYIRDRWRERLRSAGCTILDLAVEMGVSERSISNYLHGRKVPSESVAIEADRAVARIRARRWAVGQ